MMADSGSQDSVFSPRQQYAYEVFLSFRGQDTRTGFTDHLYAALKKEGFHTFRDDNEIERGKDIGLEIKRAVHSSKMAVVVFSKDYAASRWCLTELVMLMERRRTTGQVVLPVYYHVDPSQVQHQTAAFAGHEKRFKDEVEDWRRSLEDLSELRGFCLQNGYESDFIDKIVKEVRNILRRPMLNVPLHLVGGDTIPRRIDSWLKDGSEEIGVATISGIGGIGKTTVAKIAYNLNSYNFDGSCFLADVRESSKQPNGLVRLQRQLLSDLLKRKAEKIYSVHEGIMRIQEVVSNKTMLLVLDDVDDLEQFDAIVGARKWFYPGSKIIITTRYESLVRSEEGDAMFRITELDEDASLQLFSWYAFGQDHPFQDFEELSKKVLRHCGGLPLALQVLGSLLCGKTLDVWSSALQKIEMAMESKIQNILKASYDSLHDDHDRNLFLDVACFFAGMKVDYVVTILDGCNCFPRIGLENLVNRCLVTINSRNKLMMHQLIRDMGREIVRQESPDHPGRRSRLFNSKNCINVLKDYTEGTESIRGFSLKVNKSVEEKAQNKGAKALADSFSTKAFSNMQNLKLLHLRNIHLKGGYEHFFSNNLLWLCWEGFPLSVIPPSLRLHNLVVLDMQYSKLKYTWKGVKLLSKLKILNLSHSYGLVRTPNFKGLPSLEQLVLKDCRDLVSIHESIVLLPRLVLLNLKNCTSLKTLPPEIHMVKSLEELNVSGCECLNKLPQVLEKMKSLKVLHAGRAAINQVRASAGDWGSLIRSSTRHLIPKRYANKLTSLSLSFLPCSLVSLTLAECNLSDNVIPLDLSFLSNLKHLDLRGNPIRSLPGSLVCLSKLESLNVSYCRSLQSLPPVPKSVNVLSILNCSSLERIGTLGHDWKLGTCLEFSGHGCDKLLEIQGMWKYEPISNSSPQVLHKLGLSDIEPLQGTEVEIGSWLPVSPMKSEVQVLYENGLYSTFIPTGEVPKCFSFRKKGTSSASFVASQAMNLKTCGMSVCVLYSFNDGDSRRVFCIQITNKTKGLRWPYRPVFHGDPGINKEMLWLSYWKFKEEDFEEGDQVEVSLELALGVTVKEMGIRHVHEHVVGKDTSCVFNEAQMVEMDPLVRMCQILCNASEAEKNMILGEFDRVNEFVLTWERKLRRSQDSNSYGRIQDILDLEWQKFNAFVNSYYDVS